MMNFREICKTVFFCIVSVNLGVSSGLEILGFLFAALFVAMHIKQYVLLKSTTNQRKIPRYRKLFAYGAIVPFALWWLLTPSVENGVSPYLVFIPAWYLLYLALLQKRSLGNGGYEVFVVFNGVAALFMGLFQAPRAVVVSATVALLLAVYAFGRPRVALYKRLLFVLMYASLCGSSYLGFKYWKSNHYYSGRWAEDYYLKNRVMGFDPVAALGSFSSNYNSKYNNEIILRIWDTLAPQYLRAAAYEKYVAGIWKLPTTAEKKLYPARYRVDYAIFETEDSITMTPNVKTVWVQATLDNFGFMFAAPNAVGVASKNADSLDYYSTNVFAGANGMRSDWFYYVPDTAATLAITTALSDEIDSAFLQIPEKDLNLLDTIASAMALPVRDSVIADSASLDKSELETQFAVKNLKAIENYFIKNFKYSYVVSWRKSYAGMSMNTGVSNMKDMLALFWKNKEGYCEYYATLATLLLRHQGIPARYVTGFAHPEHVEGRPYVTFRRRHSHAWVEVYIDHKWYIFDPTPPVLVNAFAESSWFSKKIEGLKGRVSYVLHLLKDGEWRRVVDSWQNVSERFVANPVLYGVLILLVVVFAGIRFRKYRRNRISHSVSKDAERWISLLESAEKRLARMGFVRASGETVSAFMVRIKQTMMAQQSARQTIKKASPKDSRFEKDCLSLLKQLEDYENNRWR
ncbi:transglutaminase domain-containing protein [Fibrobacter sp. UWB11]|uniref:transglutaminase domain-containing protein n=1 Tax=Fibrobacter sp. UWB11 TaxID=1896202 RepID=UPI0009283B64|nr:transglutaminase domain-containing protein [Fibrobacter sp. UWB11]SIN89121.1 Transglutaminase-like superfamily protein [Fibrobacter sp. UWB11]